MEILSLACHPRYFKVIKCQLKSQEILWSVDCVCQRNLIRICTFIFPIIPCPLFGVITALIISRLLLMEFPSYAPYMMFFDHNNFQYESHLYWNMYLIETCLRLENVPWPIHTITLTRICPSVAENS